MVGVNDIVITGLGCVTPIGIGRDAFLQGLLSGDCAIRHQFTLDNAEQTTIFAAMIDDFDGKQYVTPRKALKVMSREVQTSYAAAHLAWRDAGLVEANLDPDRMGVVYGSEMIPGEHTATAETVRACKVDGRLDQSAWGREFMKHVYPLWMLRNLPNMPACQVGIAIDARGPNNTIAQEEVSSLLALAEAAVVIERGDADLMVVGGVGSRATPTRYVYRAWQLYDQHPLESSTLERPRCTPFDVCRRGIVPSEGAGAIVLERRSQAIKRGATILGKVCSFASRFGKPNSHYGGSRQAIAAAAEGALRDAGIEASHLNHVCAQGFSHPILDIEESVAIQEVVGDVPVTAFSSYFGTVGAASGILELSASLLALESRQTLPTLNHIETDPACPVNVCTSIEASQKSHFLKISYTPFGHAAAAVLECEN